MIKVYKVADIIDGEIIECGKIRQLRDDLKELLIRDHEPVVDPMPQSAWRFGECKLPPLLSKSYSGTEPAFIYIPEIYVSKIQIQGQQIDLPRGFKQKRGLLIYFFDRLFLPERPVKQSERDEVVLRVKKIVYDEQAELSSLRSAISNLEAAIAFQKSGPKRDPIPEDVKLLVWARDGGCCIRCGSREGLHFDHVIPVAKGGGNTEKNIQILCQTCNLKKSAKIAIM